MIENLIQNCGFKESQARILSYLLLHGPQRASLLAQRLGIKRPTVYAILSELIEVGIITRKRVRGGTIFSTGSPQVFPEMIRTRLEAQHEQALEASKVLKKFLSDLPYRGSREYAGLEIETIESEKAIYAQLYNWLLSGSFCAVFDPQISITANTRSTIREFLRKTAETCPHIREIAVSGPMCSWYKANIKNSNHRIKEISDVHPFPADFILIENKIVFIDYKPEHETAICIKHPEFAKTLQSAFELLWANLD